MNSFFGETIVREYTEKGNTELEEGNKARGKEATREMQIGKFEF
jgi:hypothetical protein